MREMSEQLAYFQQYAEVKLQHHIDELHGQNEHRIIDQARKNVAYKQHQKIFEKELSKKIDQLAPAEFDYIRLSLWSMKQIYANKFVSCRGLM